MEDRRPDKKYDKNPGAFKPELKSPKPLPSSQSLSSSGKPVAHPKSTATDHSRVSVSGKQETNTNENQTMERPSNRNESWTPSRNFLGRFGHTYDQFLNFFLTNRDKFSASYETLGAVSSNPEYYFVESKDSRKYAEDFLTKFWSSKENREITVRQHQSRQTNRNIQRGQTSRNTQKEETNSNTQKEPTNRNIQKEQFPNCISFIDATVTSHKFGRDTQKKYCFIALSGENYIDELMDALKDEIRAHNASGVEPEMVLLTGDTRSFNKLLKFVGKDPNYQYIPCSEKTFGLFLLKAFMELNITVNGCINCDFYPYEKGVKYGSQENSKDPTVKPPLRRNGCLMIANESTLVPLKPCCQDCQRNRTHFLQLCKGAQAYKHTNKPPQERSLSPIRNSIRTYTSLLTNNPNFNSNKASTLKSETNNEKKEPSNRNSNRN